MHKIHKHMMHYKCITLPSSCKGDPRSSVDFREWHSACTAWQQETNPSVFGHEPLLHVEGLLVPRHDPRAQLEGLAERQRAPVADGGGSDQHWGVERTRRQEEPVPRAVRVAREVALAQIAGVIHVTHKVQVVEENPSVDHLLRQNVSNRTLEPGLDHHPRSSQEIPDVKTAEQKQRAGQNPQQHDSVTQWTLLIIHIMYNSYRSHGDAELGLLGF